MNLRNVTRLACVVLALTAPLAAEQAGSRGRKIPSKIHAETVTITGCVAQGVDADHYVLTNAVRRKQPPSAAAVAGSSKEVGSDKAGASDRTEPYDLQGGEFKAHLGHTVEVTGTGGIGKTTDTKKSGTAAEGRDLPSFNVQSVKMVSAACS